MKAAAEDFRPLLVGGAPGPAAELASALERGGDAGAVRNVSGRPLDPYDVEGAGVLLYAVEGGSTDDDERSLRLADRKGVDAVCVVAGAADGPGPEVPYVLATDVVPVRVGAPLPLEAIFARLAKRAGDKGYALAARLPALRPAVCAEIVAGFSRQNGILGAAVFVPGADLPALTLNQLRMVFRIAAAYGEEIDRERLFELAVVLGAGFGLRAAARQVLGLVPGPGWAIKGAVAYAGTRALGEAAIAYFERGVPKKLFTHHPAP